MDDEGRGAGYITGGATATAARKEVGVQEVNEIRMGAMGSPNQRKFLPFCVQPRRPCVLDLGF